MRNSIKANAPRALQIEEFLMAELPRVFCEKYMADRMCFRTEVRDTGFFVCGIHPGSGQWKKATRYCPEANDAASLTEHVVYSLAEDYYKDPPRVPGSNLSLQEGSEF